MAISNFSSPSFLRSFTSSSVPVSPCASHPAPKPTWNGFLKYTALCSLLLTRSRSDVLFSIFRITLRLTCRRVYFRFTYTSSPVSPFSTTTAFLRLPRVSSFCSMRRSYCSHSSGLITHFSFTRRKMPVEYSAPLIAFVLSPRYLVPSVLRSPSKESLICSWISSIRSGRLALSTHLMGEYAHTQHLDDTAHQCVVQALLRLVR